MADMIESQYRPVQDPAENEYLSRIAKRLLAALPPTTIQFRVILVDSPEVNGFSLAGGRVYLTRKLVANANSEDEVASVIAHEMGHILSHQFAVETTADLKRLLGVTSVSDKADIYAKFQRLVDARMADKHPSRNGDSDESQDEADVVAVYASAAAGYRPQAYSEFWDRMFFLDGKVGGRLSDFFRTTKPESKRLRAMLKLISALPPGCGATESSASPDFNRWHALVVANQPASTTLSAKPLTEVALAPPLRMDLQRLRFSHDGKYILAQDENSIAVLTRDPYKQVFRFDAENALPAEFAPDSQRIVFHTPGLHTEEWSVPEQKLAASHEPISKQVCLQTKLSPDGRTIFCFSASDERLGKPGGLPVLLDLTVLDSATGTVLFQKKEVFMPADDDRALLVLAKRLSWPIDVVPGSVSADGNLLIVGASSSKIAFDLKNRVPISMGKSLKSDVNGAYAFVGDDRVIGNVFIEYPTTGARVEQTGIFSFPDGKKLGNAPFHEDGLESVTGGNYVATDTLEGYAAAVADLSTNDWIMTSQRPAVDVWDDFLVNQNAYGGLVLHDISKATPDQAVALPPSTLGRGLLVLPSFDGSLLALSTRSLGGVWDLRTGQRVMLSRRFTSAAFASDNSLYVQFPKDGKQERAIAHFELAPFSVKPVPYKETDDMSLYDGMLQEWKPSGKHDATLIVHNVADSSVLWQQTFAGGGPARTINLVHGQTILSFPFKTEFAKSRINAAAGLATQAAGVKNKDAGRVIQVLDNSNGNVLHEVAIEVPLTYEGVEGINVVGDKLYLSSDDNRTMVYALASGAQLRQFFGYVIALDPVTGRICTVNRRDEALVYDTDGKQLADFYMGSPLRFATFPPNTPNHLILLTADQKIRTMEIPGTVPARTATTTSAANQ